MERAEAGSTGSSPGALGHAEAGGLPWFHDQVVPAGSSSSRVIVHVDLDCFYAQVEMISNPELKSKPLGVQQKYLVVTCNYEARKLGVKKLMNVRDAKEKCPQLVLVNGEDLTRYREMSYKVTELLEEFSPVVERLGFDENFVDLTEMVEKRLEQLQSDEPSALTVSGHVYGHQPINLHDIVHIRLLIGSQIAAEMREAMYNQLGLTGCAGVASNKLLAKLVSGIFKPNQQTLLLPESSQDLIHSLNHIKEMPGIGYKTTKRLEALGISSVRDLQTFPSKILEKELGISVAQRIQKLSFGEDNCPVTPSGPPQSFSEEDSFKKCSSEVEAKNKIEELLASLLNRVCQDGRKPHTIRLIIRRYSSEKHYSRESRQCPIPSHIIQKLGIDLLVKFMAGPLIFHSPQPQLQPQAQELCDFLCFLPSLFIFLATLLGVGFCPLPHIRSVLSGSKASGFHSQPHPGKTTIQTALCKWGYKQLQPIKLPSPLHYLSSSSFS
nr:DNA polymerase iota isoform X9 [Kogia breviceps]